MKTIFITISRGGTARNILKTDAYKILKASGNRLVILTPAWRDERFLKEFGGENIYFENLVEPQWTALDRILVGLHMALIYNRSIELWDKHGIFDPKDIHPWRYKMKKFIFLPLSKIRALRDLVKWLDKILIKDRYYGEIFEKYNPDLVFSTSVMEDADVFVLKQAQERKIPTIGMVKTWDNTSKMSFRVKVDKLIVWSDYVKSESLKFQNYKEKDIIVCGVPQFDFYAQPEWKTEREEFFSSIGADPAKKLLVFGSEGKISSGDGEIAEIIMKAVASQEIKGEYQLFIRPHFMYLGDEKKFDSLKNNKNVIIDSGYEHSMVFRDKWDYSDAQIKKFSNLMRYADIMITTASTLILDAAACDKPIVSIAFDGYQKKPLEDSIAKWYLSEYLQTILEQDGLSFVKNKEELIDAVNAYIADPQTKGEGRERLRNYFCYKIDGKAGERIGMAVINYLNNAI